MLREPHELYRPDLGFDGCNKPFKFSTGQIKSGSQVNCGLVWSISNLNDAMNSHDAITPTTQDPSGTLFDNWRRNIGTWVQSNLQFITQDLELKAEDSDSVAFKILSESLGVFGG